MCERNSMSVIYLSFLWWSLHESHNSERHWLCSEATAWSLLTGISFSCLFVCLPWFRSDPKQPTQIFAVSSGWCPVSIDGPESMALFRPGGSGALCIQPLLPYSNWHGQSHSKHQTVTWFHVSTSHTSFYLTILLPHMSDKCSMMQSRFSNYDPATFFFLTDLHVI